jgi:hypothetical protein
MTTRQVNEKIVKVKPANTLAPLASRNTIIAGRTRMNIMKRHPERADLTVGLTVPVMNW